LVKIGPGFLDYLAFETGHGSNDESQYIFTQFAPSSIISNRISSQEFPASTAVRLSPIETRRPPQTQGEEEETLQYEITQSGLKFKGNVKGIKIRATQVASKVGHCPSEYNLPGGNEQHHQSPSQGKKDSGFISQNGIMFLQSITDTETELNQSVGGKEFYKVNQDGVEVEGETTGGSMIYNAQIW